MIIVQTPLRISFVGGGTDFKNYWSKYGGAVISTAIDKFMYIIVKQRFDDEIYINYSRKEQVKQISEIQHGLIREAMRKAGVENGVEITTLADVPSEGSGLGSSSSLTVGLLHAFYTYQGFLVTAEQLAREACEIEIEILGAPIGIQDQYIAAYGGLRCFQFRRDGSVDVENINLTEAEGRQLGSNMHLFYLNRTRKANDVLCEQNARISDNKVILDSLHAMVNPFKQVLINRNFDEIGLMLDKAWEEKKKLAQNITNPEIEAHYQAAKDAGALGGKVAGAGGGGFLMLYCQRDKQNSLFQRMKELKLKELPFHLERYGSRVVYNQKNYDWR